MYSKEDLMEVLNKRRDKGLDTQMHPLEEDSVAMPEHVAAMPQPTDQIQHEDPMKETGPGYHTAPTPRLEGTQDEERTGMMGALDGKESEEKLAQVYTLLGSKNAKGLRGKAMQEYEEKKK